MPSKVKILAKEQLKLLHTGSLMKRREALLQCEDSFELSDRFGHEEKPHAGLTGLIEYKDSNEWKKAYLELKEVLATREHVPNKQERKQMRKVDTKK